MATTPVQIEEWIEGVTAGTPVEKQVRYDVDVPLAAGQVKILYGGILFTFPSTEKVQAMIDAATILDPNAIHVATPAEIVGIPTKVTPVDGDWLVIEDSENADIKQKMSLATFPDKHTHPNKVEIDKVTVGDHDILTTNPHSTTKTQVGLGNVDDLQQIPLSEKAAANGVATLDGGGKVPASQLSLSNMIYKGAWNADTNTPVLGDSGAGGIQGDYYVVNVAGTTSIDGISDWKVTDWIVNNGTVWEKVDNTDQVTSVAGKQGAVTLVEADITDLSHVDPNAIHGNVAAEISAITEITRPSSLDSLLLEQASDSNNKKKILSSNLPSPVGYLDGLEMSFLTTSTLQIAAGRCRDSAGTFDIVNGALRTADIAILGAGGLDVGLETADTWYAVFIIDDSTGVNVEAALLSISPTAPTLPAGYDIFRRVGWVRNNGSSNFIDFRQYNSGRDRKIIYEVNRALNYILSGGNDTAFTVIDASSLIPPTVEQFVAHVEYGMDNWNQNAHFRPTGSTVTDPNTVVSGTSNNSTRLNQVIIDLYTNASQSLEYFVDNAADDLTVGVAGYYDSL